MTKAISVTIEGRSALLMHAFPLLPIEGIEKKTPAEQAELSAYRQADTRELYIPAMALQRALVAGATYVKGKGRGSLQKQVAACVLISPHKLGLGVTDYSIDSRPVVVPATKGRVMRHRPTLESWSVKFLIEYDEILLSAQNVRDVVDYTGSRVGILDFRPEHKGPFGRFQVVKWDLAR